MKLCICFGFCLSSKWFCLSSVQLLSHVRLFVTPGTAARQASLSITNSRSLPKLMSILLVMPSNHLIFCCPLLLLPSIFPSISIFSNESALHIRCSKYWEFQLQHQSFQWTPRTVLLLIFQMKFFEMWQRWDLLMGAILYLASYYIINPVLRPKT